MQPPELPLPTDCCGTGCAVCVYDIYFEQRERYDEWLAENTESDAEIAESIAEKGE